jgi:DNA (cytosine-5)-methyltransferase 1
VEVWSFFSGAMGLDNGFELAGLAPTLAVEVDKDCCNTIRMNRPDLCLIEGSVADLDMAKLRNARNFSGDVDIMIGGPPCQSFSTGGKRAGVSDPRGNMIYEYIRLIQEVKPRYFLLENVANIITSAIKHRKIADRPGKKWNLKSYQNDGHSMTDGEVQPLSADELSGSAVKQILSDINELGYSINFGILDAADFGAPQHRLRFVLIGSRDGEAPQLPVATHGAEQEGRLPFVTVRDAISDLQNNPGEHSVYTEKVEFYFRQVPTGGNWRKLPEELKQEAMGGAFNSGGGKTGFYRRLPWDAPAPTITGRVNRKATALCHPVCHRPISVLECARLQGFPDSWVFTGSASSKYLQIGNAVPVELGKACALEILKSTESVVQHDKKQTCDFDKLLEAAEKRLRASARNKIRRKNNQEDLFDAV